MTQETLSNLDNNLLLYVQTKRITNTGQLLRYARWYRGLKQKDIAAAIGVTYQQYQKYEYGILYPEQDKHEKLCKILRIHPDLLKLCYAENMSL